MVCQQWRVEREWGWSAGGPSAEAQRDEQGRRRRGGDDGRTPPPRTVHRREWPDDTYWSRRCSVSAQPAECSLASPLRVLVIGVFVRDGLRGGVGLAERGESGFARQLPPPVTHAASHQQRAEKHAANDDANEKTDTEESKEREDGGVSTAITGNPMPLPDERS